MIRLVNMSNFIAPTKSLLHTCLMMKLVKTALFNMKSPKLTALMTTVHLRNLVASLAQLDIN